jgi:hypothetical protein
MQFKFISNGFILSAYCKNELHDTKNESNELNGGRFGHFEKWEIDVFTFEIKHKMQTIFKSSIQLFQNDGRLLAHRPYVQCYCL